MQQENNKEVLGKQRFKMGIFPRKIFDSRRDTEKEKRVYKQTVSTFKSWIGN